MAMSDTTLTKEKLVVKGLHSFSGKIELEIDSQGDLLIEHEDGDPYIYIPKEQLPLLRDWLNRVLPK